MTVFIITALLCGACAHYPSTNIALIHDYIIEAASKACQNHSGVHYIGAKLVILKERSRDSSENDYPGYEEIKFRCQDGAVHEFDTGVGYFFIQEYQIKETFK